MTDITPERLRELAKICDPPVNHINVSLAAPEIAAALRAAADQTELVQAEVAAGLRRFVAENDRLLAAIASRDALLKRAIRAVRNAHKHALAFGLELRAVEWSTLAAEIAALQEPRND